MNDDFEFRIISEFLLNKIPMVLDMENQDLKYDSRSMYFKIYKYILKLREEVKKKNGFR